MKKTVISITLAFALATFSSCGAQKAAVKDSIAPEQHAVTAKADAAALTFTQKVSDQKVYAQNIVSSMSFRVVMGDKDITVPGAIRMRRDKVIRLQLFIPLLGNEIGRLEFTPDYVLVVDRLHKEYIKGDYNQLDFLRDNGLSFYSLQALFWNQLLLPGSTKVGEGDLAKFAVDFGGTDGNNTLRLTNGNMTYQWKADNTSGRIVQARASYKSAAHGTSDLLWNYSAFAPLGQKMFPATQVFSFSTTATKKARKCTVYIEMGKLKTDSGWEEQTTVSDRYKKMEVSDVLGKLLSM